MRGFKDRFLQIMDAWKQDRADDGTTLKRLLELDEQVTGKRKPEPKLDCLHELERLAETARPFRYECRKCGKQLKIANGLLVCRNPGPKAT